MSRRAFVRRMTAVGLTAPMATQLLALSGVAMAQSRPTYKPTKRGGGGLLKVLWWQGPTLLNPHFAVGTKDQDGSRLFYEPLAGWDADGNLRPILAESIPGREDGTLAADGKSVTWKLKKGVTWHDGKPFTADDVRLHLGICPQSGDGRAHQRLLQGRRGREGRSVHGRREIPGSRRRSGPTPSSLRAGCIIPKHLFADYIGDKSRDAPTNLKPVGTGPYKFKDFKPGDMVAGVINTSYHMENRPHFDAIEMKGGGDAVSAARAVLQTGEFDFAWNMQVEDEILQRLEKGGKGRVIITQGGGIEHIQLNTTDPWTEVDGERSSLKTKHPTLSDPAVRQALALLVDKDSVEKLHLRPHRHGDGELHQQPGALPLQDHEVRVQRRQGQRPPRQGRLGQGRRRHPRQGRQEAEVRLPDLDQPAAPEDPGDRQAGLPEGRHRHRGQGGDGVGVLLVGRRQPRHLHQVLLPTCRCTTTAMAQPDPEVFLRQFCSWEASTKANKWQGRNITRWQNKEYDDIHKAAQVELDPVKRAAMLIKLNELVGEQPGRDPRGRPTRRRGREQQARRRAERLGQQHVGSGELVQGGLTAPRRRMVIWSRLQ